MVAHRLKESAPDANSIELALPTPEPEPKPSHAPSQRHKRSFLQWFYNLSISHKTQLVPLFTFVVLGGIVGAGAVLIVTGGRTQLVNQAKAELAVTEINYDTKINQMGTGFRSQSENPVIIAAAQASVTDQILTPALQNQVKQLLQNEAKVLKIEYATLVGKDLRIIANANRDRTGEIFNPNNLVSEFFGYPRQIKTSAIVSRAELAKETPLLPPSFANQDALIRYTVTPVIDPATKTVVGAIVSGDIVNGKLPIVEETLKTFGGGYSAVYLHKSKNNFALATALDKGKGQLKPSVELPNTSLLNAAEKARGLTVAGRMDVGGQTYTTAAKALLDSTGDPVAILVRGTPETQLNALLTGSLSVQLLLSALGLGVIVLLATILRWAIAKPVRELQRTAQEFSEGNLQSRAEAFAADEVGQLAVTFNKMADSIEANLEQRRQEAERAQLFTDIASSRARDSQDLEFVFNKALTGAQQILKADRVFLYQFNSDWSGNIIAEAAAPTCPSCLGAKVTDTYFTASEVGVERYRNGRVFVIDDIYEAGLTDCHLQIYEQFGIKANVIVPIVKGDQLMGLMCAQQCSGPRAWQKSEIDFLTQLAAQLGLILDRVTFLEQLRTAKEQLQQRALELLMQVEPISKGDLTIRASVTEDEIGTIADSYNATVASLRKIVTQVQAAATQVAATTNSSEVSVQELSKEALRQTQEITQALDRIQEMSNSIRAVATSAQQAEAAVQQATQTVKEGDAAMNRTVEGIVAIRETVAQTSKKVKRLGESSQKISKVVNLIGTVAEQTNLLALNAAIEAANAGEQGRGFAVVAEQVRSLARQSQAATAEIESLVKEIQTETNEVVAAMEAGTEQVVTGTKLVNETRLSLNQITATSAEIGALVTDITSLAVAQSQASLAVTETMSDVAAIANKTSNEATVVSASFQDLLAVACQLQASVGQFKVS